MDQVKIGKFISDCRKKQNLTQAGLAEQLGITDRAISKWETGRALPDSSIMLDLCKILKISVNDLLNGEVVTMSEYDIYHNGKKIGEIREQQNGCANAFAVIIASNAPLALNKCPVIDFVELIFKL